MSARTPSGDRLDEWAELVDEDVPEEIRTVVGEDPSDC